MPSAAQRRAEALADVCRWFLANGDKAPSGARNRPQLSVVVSLSDLAQDRPGLLADGTAVPGSTVSRLACDAVLHRIVMAGRSTILDYGSGVRTVSPALWAALVVRDGHCRHPGCDRPPAWCEAHHVQHFSKGGPTCLSNLVMACNRHHHLWHDHGWELELSRRRHPGPQIAAGEGHHEPATAGASGGVRRIIVKPLSSRESPIGWAATSPVPLPASWTLRPRAGRSP